MQTYSITSKHKNSFIDSFEKHIVWKSANVSFGKICDVFKTYWNATHDLFEFFNWHFSPIFVLLKLTCLLTLFDCKILFFKNSPNWPFLAFELLLPTQNVKVAHFLCVTFFIKVKTQIIILISKKLLPRSASLLIWNVENFFGLEMVIKYKVRTSVSWNYLHTFRYKMTFSFVRVAFWAFPNVISV